jgi:Trypsin-like peptidase domain
MYIQSDLIALVGYSISPTGGANVEALFGTGFLLGDEGVFLTAAHVIRQAVAARESGQLIGVSGHNQDGKLIAPISAYEFAPNGQDIAIGVSKYTFKSTYKLDFGQYEVWQRVATAGYPEDAVVRSDGFISIPLRAYKGIIQRIVNQGHLALSPKAQGYELSFSPAPGSSGAPLFVHTADKSIVIGVCVGSFRTEQVEDEITEVSRDGSRYIEKRVRINQFGLAEATHPLAEWVPGFLGKRVSEI